MNLSITEDLHGLRIDKALAQLFPEYSRSLLTTWIKQGYITSNGLIVKPKTLVFANDFIQLDECCFTQLHEATYCQPQEIPLTIVFEDESLLVINKPAGLVVHPGAGNHDATLVNALLFYQPSLECLPRAGIIHRLDKDTSGLLIVAKTQESYTLLIQAMQERLIQRHYVALVHGITPKRGEIKTFFGRHTKNRLKMAVLKHGKEAITQYRVNTVFDRHTLLNIQLFTGRTHQIRVHMAHIGHPIVGDKLYGDKIKEPFFPRQALLAQTLHFNHPIHHELLTFRAEMPEDFIQLLQQLE